MSFTQRQLEQFTFRGKLLGDADIRWDDTLPGFGVRVWASGKKTFLVRYRIGGRRRYLTLGAFPVLTLVQARSEAKIRLADVLQGIDPLEERRRAAYGETVAKIAEAYVLRHSVTEKSNYRDDQQKVRDYITPLLGSLKIKQLTRADLVRMKDKIGYDLPKAAAGKAERRASEALANARAAGQDDATANQAAEKARRIKRGGKVAEVRGGKVCANRVLALVSSIWGWAKERGLIEEGTENPAAGVDRFPEVPRDRYVSEEELPRLAAAIKAEKNPFLQALFWLYLMTGMRKSELAKVQWAHVDLERSRIHVGKTKNGRPLYLPLMPAAVIILESLPRYEDNPHVFVGRRTGKPLSGGIHQAWRRIRKDAGLEDVRIHDLRHTVASWLVNSGVSLPMIGRILNHKHSRTTQRYAHLELSPIAKELGEHGTRLLAAAGADAPVTLDVKPAPASASSLAHESDVPLPQPSSPLPAP